ncbi:putative ubiquitin-specific processing protease 21 [Rhizophagus irregularis]|uniref:ubiquitinyl hydrolase 1 n=1 Tax=Rhizophagus irregularis TaxID=588596 RepID=A0A2N0PX00_9GLOM|nr:putative ubiquitin-specific processing protease 21 [Rhizophagus irregularis]
MDENTNNMDLSEQTTNEERPMSDVEDTTPLPVTDYEAMANKIMPELGQEIEDFKYDTWHVTNWRHLEKRITGPEFEAGNWKWRILLFPSGNNNQDTVSIYLDFVDPKGAPAGWHSCVQFALVLWNPEDPTQYIYHHAHHRFTAEESDWGFTRFYDLRKLLTPCENRTRALIENDSTNITAFVRVLKDPTGVLWHNFINYDSKKETGYVGLKNQGATCYMNSLLQSLYCTTYFRKAVYQIPTEDDEPIKSVSLALQRVFYQLQTSNTPVGTTELTKSFGWDSIDSFMQHDVQEFNRVLQDNLEGKMKSTKADGAITKLFVGKMKSYIKCVNVDYESSRVEDYYDIQLNVKGCKTLRDSFKDYIQEETLEGDNKYQAEGYGLQDAKKGVIFESFPPVLHLQLKRFEYDIQRDAMVKINDRHEFPMEIDLEEFLSEDADRSSPHKYLLHGVLVHSGDLHGGHYFALLKPEKDGKWFKFDDDRVTPVIDKEVLEDNYGGESPNANAITIRSAGRNHKRFTNAYMLVYIRESNVDEILSPVVHEDIPEHLQKRLEEERAEEERRRKEMEERHLYLIVKIVTAEKFKVHQGFDLANFDDRQYPLSDVFTYKILKADTYGSFKEHVARSFNIPTEQVRFWVLVNRQNKTVRPDAPIADALTNTSMEEIHAKMTSRQNEMKLYMEVADKPINGKTWFPTVPEANHIMVFLKYFDPDKQALEGLGHLYIQKFGKVGDITRVLCEKKEFPPDTPLKIYEEIKPNMIEEMKLKSTFQQSEIQDGDIICFQKALTEKEIQEHTTSGRYWDIPHFYESLTLRIVVLFKPKLKDRDPKPEFEIVLNKKWTYDQVAGAAGTHLNTDPLKLRFTTAHSTSGTPKNVIKRTTNQTLSEMLQTAYLSPPAHVLFYEMLKISIVELETKKFIKVYWLGNTVKDEEVIELGFPKDAVVNDIIDEISKHEKVTSSSPNSRIRLFDVHHNKIQKEYTGSEPIERIQEHTTLYAEEIPQDEIHADQNDRTIQVYHFTKDPIRVHGIPFKFVIKNGETLADTKVRLRHRLGMNEKDFSKVKIAIVPGASYAKPEYLEDDDIILSEKKLSNEECLGLDHVDKTGRAGRVGGVEKAIFIRG